MIIERIDDYLKTRPRDKRYTHCFHPSTLYKPAEYLLKAYFDGDSEGDYSSQRLRVFDNGHDVHKRIQNYLRELGILREVECPVENREYEIKGHADGVLEIDGKKGVLEIKSINSRGFYGLLEPDERHLIQANVYMFCLGIPRGVILYENKDNQDLREFLVTQDPKVIQPVLEKIKLVQSWISTGRVGAVNQA